MKQKIFFLFVLLASLHCRPDPPVPYVIVEAGTERGKWMVTGLHFPTAQAFETCLEKHLLLPAKDRGEVVTVNDTTRSAAAFQNLEIWPGLGRFELIDDELTRPKTKQPLTSKRPSQ
jgi:hypothetical protein